VADAGSLQQELDRLADELGHSLSVDAPDGRLIAYSAQGADADQVRIAAILSRQVDPAVLEWELRHGIAEATGPVHVPANAGLGMAARLCVPIRRGRGCLGYLWVLDAGAVLDDAARAAALRAARAMAPVLDPHPPEAAPTARRDVGELLRALLGESPPRDVLDRLVAAAPSLLGARIRVYAAVPAAPGRGGTTPFGEGEFRRLVAALPAGLRAYAGYVGSFVGESHAVVLARHGADEGLADALDRIANTAVSPAGCAGPSASDPGRNGPAAVIGAGEPAPFTVDAARTAHAQALAAAELAALDPALPTPLAWRDLGPYRRLLHSGPPPSDDGLAPLDRAGASAPMLLHTLETYLDLGGDAGRTATRLHLHRTSLYYRLGRISELLGADLTDGLVRLDLHLALKHRRLARRTLG
jgi:hypothetical protein